MPPFLAENLPTIALLAVTILSIVLGGFIAERVRMKELSWKLSVILLAIGFSGIILAFMKPKLGIDLRGGDILIYEIDRQATAQSLGVADGMGPDEMGPDGMQPSRAGQVSMPDLLQSIGRRINPGGVREVVIREYGTNQIEIIIPEVSKSEIDTIKASIRKSGFLKFRIVADRMRHPFLWELGEKQLASDDELVRSAKFVLDGDRRVGEWVRLGREDVTVPGTVPPYRIDPALVQAEMLSREIVPDQIEVLTVIDEKFDVEGKDLAGISRGMDEYGRPAVDFSMTSVGSGKMAGLTSANLPNESGKAKLGIILDNELLSCPVINSMISTNGTIEGNFTETEVSTLLRILRDGKMPAVLFPEPISENSISPLLGLDTIRKGQWAIAVSFVLVMAFMLWYYRFSGLVACVALVFNLLLTVASMYAIKASFTLAGIAGLVLTVGMSVDANVLIFERIREELGRGASLRMALRNGFERATVTIIDANVTTVIVAVVLYMIGTADLRGFAVSLILGIAWSMFTAIFCSRVFLDIAERQRWIRDLKMRRMIGETNIGFLRMGPVAIAGSILLIGLGMTGVAVRGAKLFDIDFRGGTSLQVLLNEPVPIETMREKLAGIADDVWVTEINPQDHAAETVYKVDTSLQDEQELQELVREALVDKATGKPLWSTRGFEFDAVTPYKPKGSQESISLAPSPEAFASETIRLVSAQDPGGSASDPAPENKEPVQEGNASEQTVEPAKTGENGETAESAESAESTGENRLDISPDLKLSEEPEASNTDSSADGADSPRETKARFQASSTLRFQEKISVRTLERLIEDAANAVGVTPPRIKCSAPDWDGRSEKGFDTWTVDFTTSPAQTELVLQQLESSLSDDPVWLSSNKIGGKIAGHMRTKAILAIVFSLVAIIGYLWFRFQSVAYGLAAVIAVIHDVLVTLGFVALSFWLSRVAGFLMIDEFKISLPIVAAFLTLIGYSLNDTIVIFDRIREVKGKSPDVTAAMVDLSNNQCLGRTFLTSFTVLMVVIVLYVMGGDGIHGFAFSLLIGIIAGTYSTVFIACPALLWILDWWRARTALHEQRYLSAVR